MSAPLKSWSGQNREGIAVAATPIRTSVAGRGSELPAAASARRLGSDDSGQILLLALGYLLVAFALVAVAVDATAVHLARTQLLDAADAAALDAADAVDPADVYAGGIARDVPLTSAGVRAQALTYLSSYQPPSRISQVRLLDGTGSPDGASAVVALTGTVRLPIAARVVANVTGGVMVSVRSTARAQLRP